MIKLFYRLDVVFPVLIKLDKKILGGQAVLRFGLAITEEIMNSVFLSGGFRCVTYKGPCILVSENDLYLLQTEIERLMKKRWWLPLWLNLYFNFCYVLGLV